LFAWIVRRAAVRLFVVRRLLAWPQLLMAASFADAASAVSRGDSDAVQAILRASPGLAGEEDAYDEVMEQVDGPSGGIAMAPVVGTLLHLASKYGRLDIARMLLDAGAEVNRTETVHWHDADTERRTPLHLSIWSGSTEMVDLLVQRGADINQKSGPPVSARSPLEEATTRGLTDIARSLLASPAAKEAVASGELDALLLRAIQAQSKDTVQLLLESKAQVNQTAAGGASPLHVAARQNSADIVGLLISHGADASNEDGECSPLVSVAANAKIQFAEWVAAAPEGPQRDWRLKMQDQQLDLVKVLVDSGALQAAPSSLRHVLDLFRALDTNQNGTIEREELIMVLGALDSAKWTEERVDKLMRTADGNRDGKINLEEFLKWIFGSNNGSTAELVPAVD